MEAITFRYFPVISSSYISSFLYERRNLTVCSPSLQALSCPDSHFPVAAMRVYGRNALNSSAFSYKNSPFNQIARKS